MIFDSLSRTNKTSKLLPKQRLKHRHGVRWQGRKGPWSQRSNMMEWLHGSFRISFHPDSCYPLLFWPCCHPPTSLVSLHTFFGLSLSYFPFGPVWDSAILPKPCASALLSVRLTKMFYWHCHKKLEKQKSKTKQSKENTTLESTLTTYKSDWLKFAEGHSSPWVHPWQNSRLTLTHVYGSAAAKNITELLETDSQSTDRLHNRSNHIISLQRFYLQGDNKKIFHPDLLLWKTCHSTCPSILSLLSSLLCLPCALPSGSLRVLWPFPGIL